VSSAAAFCFDLASPFAYLASERALHVLRGAHGPVEWLPVLARELPGGETFEAFRCEGEQDVMRAEVERRAGELGLPPLRWPAPFPFDSALAMHVATYAKSIGRAVPFAQAAFRQAFAGGHSLAQADYVLIAAAACEMHPAAVLRAADTRMVAEQLAAATARAAAGGVRDVPAVLLDRDAGAGSGTGEGETVFTGERELERAGARLAALAALEAAG
jgi:2-hydroxychromene-2-carboxylate isomerase